jgi:hypothetical protein
LTFALESLLVLSFCLKKLLSAEKLKNAKDGSSAWVDIYEYARKIREGEMTWNEVEKADLDNLSFLY